MENLKCFVILFHKNINKLYPKIWIERCLNSILSQSHENFDFFEVDYGNTNTSILNDYRLNNKKHYFWNKDFKDHSYAMNYLITKGFELGYDVCFNANLDDIYHGSRFKIQLKYVIKGYDLSSSIFYYINEYENITHLLNNDLLGLSNNKLTQDDISEQLYKNNNVINHSCVCLTRKFWETYDNNEILLRYMNNKPYEDLILWQRAALSKKIKIKIIQKPLIYYRIHYNQICSDNREGKSFTRYPGISKIRIGILLVATGKYKLFLNNIIDKVMKHFLPNYQKLIFIFTDDPESIEKRDNIITTKIYQRGFPGDTLYRYHYFLMRKHEIIQMTDVVYYMDVDMDIDKNIEENILPNEKTPLIGTKHPGFYMKSSFEHTYGSPEVREISTAYINPKDYVDCYIAGGFNGGISYEFIKMSKCIKKNIDIDDKKEIIAEWHDESHLNKYFTYNLNKFKILTPEYCWSKFMVVPMEKYIIALDKDHNFYRSSEKFITCNYLGRLGNILFQISTVFAIAKQTNRVPCFSILHKNENKNNVEISYRNNLLKNIRRIDTDNIEWQNIHETHFNYQEICIQDDENNIKLNGFFQSYKYFDSIKEDIRNLLYLKSKKADLVLKNIHSLFNDNTVSIHVRRGDYLKYPDVHHNLTMNYYEKSIQRLDFNSTFVIFSDDIKWCMKEKTFNKLSHAYFVDDLDDFESFILMMNCKHQIIANSSFSWWAAYLNTNLSKEIIYPSKWFSFKGPYVNFDDLIPKEWIKMDDNIKNGISFLIHMENDIYNIELCIVSLIPIFYNKSDVELIIINRGQENNKILIDKYISMYQNNIKFYNYKNFTDINEYKNYCLYIANNNNIIEWDITYIANISNLQIFINDIINKNTDKKKYLISGNNIYVDNYYTWHISNNNLKSNVFCNLNNFRYNGSNIDDNYEIYDKILYHRKISNNSPDIQKRDSNILSNIDKYILLNEIKKIEKNNYILILPSYNCSKYIKRCLMSIKAQNYNNMRVCVIDDASDDEHKNICSKFCKKMNWTLIRNDTNMGALYNIVMGINIMKPKDDDIIVLLDGDDFIIDNTLNILDFYYDHNILITYGNFLYNLDDNHDIFGYSNNQLETGSYNITENIIENKSYRESNILFSHLRTFRYKLWKEIKDDDLRFKDGDDKGKYYDVAWDWSFMFPMLEMAGKNIKFIDIPIYRYNISNPYNDFKIKKDKQYIVGEIIKKLKKYDTLY